MRDISSSSQSNHYTSMKTTFTLISSVVSLVALLFVLDMCYWHTFGLRFEQSPYLPGILFWVGVLFTALATSFAAWSIRKHWTSARLLGQFIWCCALCMSYVGLFLYVTHNPIQ
jgi:hypothetical protein